MERIHAAYKLWRERHPGVKSTLDNSATKDAGMWTAFVRIWPKDDKVYGPVGRSNLIEATPKDTVGWDAPDFRTFKSDWAPTKEDCLTRAVEDFERECATL